MRNKEEIEALLGKLREFEELDMPTDPTHIKPKRLYCLDCQTLCKWADPEADKHLNHRTIFDAYDDSGFGHWIEALEWVLNI